MSITYRKTHVLHGSFDAATGLRIGGGKETIEIGGIDSPVIRHPHTSDPYVPGSSLKGKLRCLLEWALHKVEAEGSVWGSTQAPPGDPILRLFGTTNKQWREGPGRLIFRDLALDAKWLKDKVDRGLPLTEAKTEVAIDRIQGKAQSFGPRTMERIPSGAQFNFEIAFREFAVDGDEGRSDRECFNRLIEAMRLLEDDALGGSGSRGYGKVVFTRVQLGERDLLPILRSIRQVNPTKPSINVWEV